MLPHVIYDSRTNANTPGVGWLVTQDPLFSGNPNMVRFYRSNGRRTLLDRIAQWDPRAQAWRSMRWAPKPPVVPQYIIDKVVAHLSPEG
ncbi:MAG: hypothetical protein ACO33A_13550 [Hyphomonas sp.]